MHLKVISLVDIDSIGFDEKELFGEAHTCVREIICSFLKKERTANEEARKDDT